MKQLEGARPYSPMELRVPSANQQNREPESIGHGTFTGSAGDQHLIHATSSGTLNPEMMETDPPVSPYPVSTSKSAGVTVDTSDLQEFISRYAATPSQYKLSGIDYHKAANENEHYYHQADPSIGDDGTFLIHHKNAHQCASLECAVETYTSGHTQFSPFEFHRSLQALGLAPDIEGCNAMRQAAYLLTQCGLDVHYFSTVLYTPEVLLGHLKEALDPVVDPDPSNEGRYLELETRMEAILKQAGNTITTENHERLAASLLQAVDQIVGPTAPTQVQIDHQPIDKIPMIKNAIQNTLKMLDKEVHRQKEALDALDYHSSMADSLNEHSDRLIMCLRRHRAFGHEFLVCFRVVGDQWYCYDGLHEQPEPIAPQAYVMRAMRTVGQRIDRIEFILPGNEHHPVLHFTPPDDAIGDDDRRLIPKLLTPQEICSEVKVAHLTDDLWSHAKRCAAIFALPYYVSPELCSIGLEYAQIRRLQLSERGTKIMLDGTELRLPPEFRKICDDYLDGEGVRPGRGRQDGVFIQGLIHHTRPNQLSGQALATSSICKTVKEVLDRSPQLAFLHNLDPASALKAACAFALMTDIPGDRTTKAHAVLHMRRNDIDPQIGNIRTGIGKELSPKTRQLVLLWYHSKAGTADPEENLVNFEIASSNGIRYQRISNLNQTLSTYRLHMEAGLRQAEEKAEYWRNATIDPQH